MKKGASKHRGGTERSQVVFRVVIDMIYPQHFVNESRLKPAGYCEPYDTLRNKFYVPQRWKRKLLQYLSPVETPLLAFHLVFKEQFYGVRVQHVPRELVAHQSAILVLAQYSNRGELVFFGDGDSIPMVFQSLQRLWYTSIVGIQSEK